MVETNKHYDIDSGFFKAFLDPYMKYTSGLYTNNESLAQGILNMLDKHVGFLQHYKAPRILEIGPGWGSFIYRLQEKEIPFEYTAINPSKVQNEFINNRLEKPVKIIESSFEEAELKPESFDLVYFIGSFCHMQDKLTQLEKLNHVLSNGGRVIIEDTFFISEKMYQKHHARNETKYVQQEVFGFAEILSLSNFIEVAANRGFQVQTILEHSSSYARTVELWLEKLYPMRESGKYPQADEFIKYLEIAQRGWRYTIANYLIEIQKVSRK
ncbi:MAG: hypothetical protein RJB66_1355 [Pseudomonadota bacterium]|jgi:cyclopropane-fatty-acyl-phospholipid synthase